MRTPGYTSARSASSSATSREIGFVEIFAGS